jgi:ribosomal protection tetracycline resistance protein
MLNLGILAHVDAGKTTLTERLLYAAGAIDAVGSVDEGTTSTDTLALERQRGITIKAAVVSFDVGDVTVNLIDTPGHPDFIAEVERVLGLLDGAVLVLSAVEGVQPQSRVLMRALRRLRVPTLLFVNKIDRMGADVDRVLGEVRARLTPATVAMGVATDLATRQAGFQAYGLQDVAFRAPLLAVLAEHDDALLAAYVHDNRVTDGRLHRALAAQTRRAELHPVYCGSAISGAGVDELLAGLVSLLPRKPTESDAPACGRVFKIERTLSGDKIAYVRMFEGTLGARQRVPLSRGVPAPGETQAAATATETAIAMPMASAASKPMAMSKATAIRVCRHGGWQSVQALHAGEIGQVWGLGDVRIGDILGTPAGPAMTESFAPPTVQTVVAALHPRQDGAMRAALARLAEADPLIDVRSDETGREVTVSLYGEVQREVIEATLADEFGIAVTFEEVTVICVERPTRVGEAVEALNTATNPFHASLGVRVEPGPPGSDVAVRMLVHPQTMPLHVYKSPDQFTAAMEGYIRESLRKGRHGWRVTDCVVSVLHCGYSLADGPPSRRGPDATAADFRGLTPLVLTRALARAATVVCEPMLLVSLEIPLPSLQAVMTELARFGAAMRGQSVSGELTALEAVLPAAQLRRLHARLPALTGGEGVIESRFDGYQPLTGTAGHRI